MRVVGYVREAPSPIDGDTAYAQGESIRRWVADAGHHLIAMCRDTRNAGEPMARDGFRALLVIVGSGDVDAVVVSEVAVLSPDKVIQEVMIHRMRSRGVTVASTSVEDLDALSASSEDQTRLVVRDVLVKADAFAADFPIGITKPGAHAELEAAPHSNEGSEVIVELIPAPQTEESAAQTARPTA